MYLNGDVRSLYDHSLNWLNRPVPERDNHRALIEDDRLPYLQTEWQTNPFHDLSVVEATNVANIHTPHDFILWNLSNLPLVSELQLRSPSTALNEDHRNPIDINPSSTLDLGWNTARGYVTFDPTRTPCMTSPDRQPLLPLLDQQSGVFWDHTLNRSMVDPSVVCSSTMTYSQHPNVINDENTAKLSIPLPSPAHQSFMLSTFRPTSTGYSETASSRPSFHRVPLRGATGSSRRGRAARAIEYGGLWIDEEELLRGLTEPDGRLNLHQCCWEEDQSLCYLWIRGDKSCINTHIQKWHGGKPGGEKTQCKCRWPGCGKMMLKESIARHIVSIHMDEVWECQGCGKHIARNDAYGRHATRSNLEECRTSGALITYSFGTKVIDAHAALDTNGRRVRYASE